MFITRSIVTNLGNCENICDWVNNIYVSPLLLQKTPQQVDFSEFGIGISWQSFMENELNSLLELSADKGFLISPMYNQLPPDDNVVFLFYVMHGAL